MPLEYDQVVPWGRTLQEYTDMFHLSEQDLDRKIIGCGDGPASFNYEMTQNGKSVTSVDPVYQFSREQLQNRINETCDLVIAKTRENQNRFVWNKIKSVQDLKTIRMGAMEVFLADYEQGLKDGRYINAELPVLPFKDDEFGLALCAHFLFLYSSLLDLSFHIKAIDEMLRVAKEVRIFPVLDSNADRSEYADQVIDHYKSSGCLAEEIKVDYEFQKTGNTLLKIVK